MRDRQRVLFGLLVLGLLAGWVSHVLRPDHGARRVDAALTSVPRSSLPSTALGRSPGQISATLQTPSFPGSLVTALESIDAENDAVKRAELLEMLIGPMPAAELLAALTWLEQTNPSGLAGEIGVRLIHHCAEKDARAAADWAGRLPAGPVREKACREVALAWADQDLPEAVAWIRQLPEADRQGGMIAVAYEAGRAAPLEALQLAMELSPGEERAELISHTASQWAATDPKAAADWANRIGDSQLRERTLAGIAMTWAESDPRGAVALAIEALGPGRALEDAVVGIVQRWAQVEPEPAAAWVAEFPAGPLRDAAVENLVKLWADQDPILTAIWLNRLGPGPGRDFAIEAYVSKIAPLFPESAVRWAETIGDEESRYRQLETVGGDWLQDDSPAAHAWIVQASLPEIAKARLLAPRGD